MIDFLSNYGLFLAKFITIFILVIFGLIIIVSSLKKAPKSEGLTVESLNKRYKDLEDSLRLIVDGSEKYKKKSKERKKTDKLFLKKGSKRARTFVLDFKGDIRASATASLREEVSAILSIANKKDEVLVRLENPGGTVHEHGLAASQLMRIRDKDIGLIISVDKVAASGGYLMACVADNIIAAPFAIIGSIGVIAQIPNFNRFLEEKGVDFEQVTAGKHKRTLTMFGKNTEEGRKKIKQELEDVHDLFKNQISEYRPKIDLNEVATGEHWYGITALNLNLIDEIKTSDDFLIEKSKKRDIYLVSYKRKASLRDRLFGEAEALLSKI
ncbi:MAG: protease SohB [Gammaproteobacteria bacterium TMED78]|nr:MAG: protease SohB [Gammaproteobacteria bacterium TMED78]|tara:strand:+ start:13106 stop:14083 length:978 start_codon:yes stop_codon:yes gene_type:complete